MDDYGVNRPSAATARFDYISNAVAGQLPCSRQCVGPILGPENGREEFVEVVAVLEFVAQD